MFIQSGQTDRVELYREIVPLIAKKLKMVLSVVFTLPSCNKNYTIMSQSDSVQTLVDSV